MIGDGKVTLEVKDGKVVSKTLSADLIRVDRDKVDTRIMVIFRPDYEAVKAFTVQEVGHLDMDLMTADSYK